jgi:hypothetical protein
VDDSGCLLPGLRDAVWGFVAPQKHGHSRDPEMEVNMNSRFFLASLAVRHKYVI